MLPQIAKLEFINDEIIESSVVHKSLLWDFEAGDFVLKDGRLVEADGLEYIKIWVEKALRTRMGTLIYESYGSEHHGLIGRVLDRDFVKSELERTIEEALFKNEAVLNVSNFVFEFEEELLMIKFTVSTIFGSTEVVLNG